MVTLEQQHQWDIQNAVEETTIKVATATRASEQERLAKLADRLERQERNQELLAALKNPTLLQKLYKEFGL